MNRSVAESRQLIFYIGGGLPTDPLGHLSARLDGNILTFAMNNRVVIKGDTGDIYDKWTHIAISHHSDKLYMYKDGALIDYYVLDTTANVTSSIHPFRIGGSPTTSQTIWYHGYITNFHFVNGEGLYDGAGFKLGQQVFQKPTIPLNPVPNTKLLLTMDYPCDPLYNSALNPDFTSSIFDPRQYRNEYPELKNFNVPIAEYVLLEGKPIMNDTQHYFFGLGKEYIKPGVGGFLYGDKVVMNATQKKYSFDYYEIHSPITVVESKNFFITYYGFTASFDPKTEVCLTTDQDISGSSSPIIAHYR
jgi:hypothetical protein